MENRDQQKNIVAKNISINIFFFCQNINQQKSTKINILVDFCLPAGPKQHKPTKINKSQQKLHIDVFVRSPQKKPTTFMFEINKI